MSIPIQFFLKDYTVFNPNFGEDVIKFMGLRSSAKRVRDDIKRINESNPLTPEQIESGELTLCERLNALIDRVEFIGHLQLVSDATSRSDMSSWAMKLTVSNGIYTRLGSISR